MSIKWFEPYKEPSRYHYIKARAAREEKLREREKERRKDALAVMQFRMSMFTGTVGVLLGVANATWIAVKYNIDSNAANIAREAHAVQDRRRAFHLGEAVATVLRNIDGSIARIKNGTAVFDPAPEGLLRASDVQRIYALSKALDVNATIEGGFPTKNSLKIEYFRRFYKESIEIQLSELYFSDVVDDFRLGFDIRMLQKLNPDQGEFPLTWYPSFTEAASEFSRVLQGSRDARRVDLAKFREMVNEINKHSPSSAQENRGSDLKKIPKSFYTLLDEFYDEFVKKQDWS